MVTESIISLEKTDISLLGDGILENHVKAMCHIEENDIWAIKKANLSLTNGKAYCILVTAGHLSSISKEAKQLASRLKTGALPVPISIASSEVIQPLLGAKALNDGLMATLYGFLAIAILMILWYRLPGLFGVISLITYAVVVLSIFKLLPVTLSAAAIAGFLISVGLAIDGNILIFERLKEELNRGKNLRDALEEGFDRAWTSVRDSHTASIIVSIILYFIGTSVVKGFALTLFIGVVVSLFTNVFVTRVLLRLVAPKNANANTKFFWKSLL